MLFDHRRSEEEEFGVPDRPLRRPGTERGDRAERAGSLDVDDVRLCDPDAWSSRRPVPPWVITGTFDEEDLGVIRTGKEAQVSLARRTAGERSCLVAVKRYAPRAQRAFRREMDYVRLRTGDSRVDRALARRTRFGRGILEYAWAYNEFPYMRAAWDAGVRVPYPVEAFDEGLVMEYVGDAQSAAPRLADVRLERDTAARAFEDLVEQVRRLLRVHLVHADLSAYNVLWWHGRCWLIDLPQAADVVRHERGLEFLRRDIANICTWFRRYGIERDAEAVFDDVLGAAPFRRT